MNLVDVWENRNSKASYLEARGSFPSTLERGGEGGGRVERCGWEQALRMRPSIYVCMYV